MNRIMLRTGIRCLIFIFAAICLISLAVPAYAADKAIAKLTSFSGTVLIKSQGTWGVQPEEDLPLYSDDKVVTRTGIATVTFDDGAVMEIKANSNLLIRETEDAAALARGVSAVKRQVRLLMGKMFFKSGRSTSTNTTLETTTMVCGLRGTAGVLSIDAAGVTYLQFSEGGGDTIGDFIAGIAPDVPAELADLNPAQRAGFVAAAAADQANQVAEKLARGEVKDADAAFAAAKAAEAAALEAKAAAEAMLNNPDPELRKEAKRAIKAANAAIKAAREAQRKAKEAGAEGEITEEETEEGFGFDVSWVDTVQGNEFDILYTHPEEAPPVETLNPIGTFSANMRGITTCHSGQYSYTGTEYTSASYYYEYTEDGSSGYTSYSYTISDPYFYTSTYTYYYEDGTTYTSTYNSDTGTTWQEGTWDRTTLDVTTFGNPPGSDWELTYVYEDEPAMGFSRVALSGELSVDESMWGTQAQTEEGVTLTAEGEMNESYAGSTIWYDEVYSNTTYDAGGAYYGIFGGLKNGNILEAGMAAIGVAPNGTVGLLRGGGYLDPITGTIAGDRTFEMEGPLTWEPKGTIPGVTAANLMDNIYIAEEGFFRLAATLGDTNIIGSYYFDYYSESPENFISGSIVTSTESAPWGIYGGDTFGEYDTGNTATTWSGHGGGYGGFGVIFNEGYYGEYEEYPEDEGWYIGDANGTWSGGAITGRLAGNFLSMTKMGDIEGDIVGTYDSTTGLWTLGALGSWDGEDLTFASQDIYSSVISATNSYIGNIQGIMGGTGSLWLGGTPVRYMGYYSDYGEASSGVFNDNYISSYDYKKSYYPDYYYTTYDGGAFYGAIGGILIDDGSLADKLDARFIALYIDPDDNAGMLTGSLTGYGYEDLEMFEMDGTINSVEMFVGIGIAPEDLHNNIGSTYFYPTGSGAFSEGGGISVNSSYSSSQSHYLLDMGVYLDNLYGDYSGATSDNWTMSLVTDSDSYNNKWIEVTGTQWSAGNIAGDVAGAWVSVADGITGISGGEILGVFNPDNLAWQAMAIGAFMPTHDFLSLAATDEGRAKLTELNIPCIQVGVTSLAGEGGAYIVSMDNVEFFAYSTGDAPKIWATGSVYGDVYGDVASYPTTSMSGDGFTSATFNMNNYNNTVGGAWDASVSGTGTVSTYPIIIQGGAAGTVDTVYEPDVTNGAFHGTAAGVAQEE